jgi:hypothetical protein
VSKEPELTQAQADAIADKLGITEPPERPAHSVNDRAEQLMGRRPTDVLPFDQPVELGYWCPVCKVDAVVDGEFDERLHWSEYPGFLWCSICDVDYPSALCVPMHTTPDPERHWVKAGPDAAISVFLDTIEYAQARAVEAIAAKTSEP